MNMQPPARVASFCRSLLANTTKLKSNRARSLALLVLIALATTALASSVSSAGALRQLIFGKASANAGADLSQPIGAVPGPMTFAFAPQGSPSLLTARRGHTATRLSDGRVLIVGGGNAGGGYLGEAEIFDPTAGTFSSTGSMGLGRSDHAAVKLADGRVLITGGRSGIGATNTTEIFDPTTGNFASGPAMSVARAGHSATLFANGTVLIAGGDTSGSAEIFDPSSSSFSTVGAYLKTARSMHSAALLADGRVLLVGGRTPAGDALSSGEIFDPPAAAFSAVDSSLKVARQHAHLRVLFDGKVQIIGGSNDGSMEIYDPLYGAFGAYAHVLPESDTCVGLPAQVLASQTRAALFYNGQSDPLFDRTGQTITEMNGQALVLGGANSSGTVLSSSSVVASSSAAITTDKMDYIPGDTVAITGRGFQPGETVRLKIHEDPHTPQERGFDAVADANGNFAGEYLVQDYDLDMKFIVGARGLTSGATAQTTFTDNKNFTITFAGTGGGSIAFSAVTGSPGPTTNPCTGTCINALNNNATGTLTVTANPGSVFAGWSFPPGFWDTSKEGSTTCTGTNSPCTFDMGPVGGGADQQIIATFNTVTTTDVTVTKTADTTPISAGSTAGYTITAKNSASGVAATNVTLTDTLPAGVTWTMSPAVAGCTISGGNSLSCTFATLGPNSSQAVHVTGTTSSANCGTLNNTATVAATNDSPTNNNTATASIVVQCPDVRVQKAANPVGPVSAGDVIGFDVTLSNIGTGNASGLSFTDSLPSGLTWTITPASSGWSISGNSLVYTPTTLNAGASTTVHVQATTSSANCGSVSNTASASANNEAAGVTANNSAPASVTIQCPDVRVQKAANPVGPVSAGDVIGFDVTLSNIGTGNASGLSFTDSLPSGLTWTINPASAGWSIVGNSLQYAPTTLAAGASTTVHVQATSSSANCGTPVSNTASASATNEAAGVTGNNSANASVTVNCPDVRVQKAANPVGPVSAGDDIGFDVTLSNIGAGNATGVSFTDTLPTGLTWTITPASPGWSISSGALVYTPTTLAAGFSTTVHVQATTSSANCGTVSNTASASATNEGTGTITNNNSATASVTVNCPDVRVQKVANPIGPVSAGDDIGFDVTLSNIGTGNAAGVSFTDTLPSGLTWTITPASPGWSIVGNSLQYAPTTLAAGFSTSVHVKATTSSANCGPVSNTASATATNEKASHTGDNTATASVTVNCPDIKVQKAANPVGPVSAGDDIGFDVTLSNIGAGNAIGVSFTDTLPAGLSWTIDPASSGWSISAGALVYTPTTLAAGASTTVHVKATTWSANCGLVSNTASASATNERSADNGNNSATSLVTVQCPDISTTKTADAAAVNAGDQIGYTITVSNSSAAGTGTAKGVTLNDTLPTNGGLSWSKDGADAGSCTLTTTLSCTFGDLAPGTSKTVHIYSPTTSATCGTVANTVSASATNEASTTLGNNSSGPVNITVNCPDLAVTKTADAATVNAGDQIGYTVTLSNIGAGTAYGVSFTDALPSGLTFSESPDSPDFSISGNTLSYTPTTIAAAGTSTVHVVATTSAANCGTVSNTASASATNEASTTLANNFSGPVNITVNCPDLAVTKTTDAATVNAGDQIGYTVTLSNIGAGTAYGVSFTDALPSGLTFSESPDSPDFSISGGNLVYTPTTLNAGDSSTVHITATTSSANCGTVSNTASASATNEASTTLANNSSGPVNTTVNCPDIMVQKTANPAGPVSAGDDIGFDVTLSNIGAGAAYGVSFTDTLPAGPTWTINPPNPDWTITGNSLMYTPTTIAAGGTSTVHVKATTAATNCGTVSNTASASASNEKSADTSNNSAAASVTVNCPDLVVSKTPDAATVSSTDQIGFTITVTNNGPGVAKNVMLSDTLPNSGLTWTESPDNPYCSISGGVLSCNFGTVASGANRSVHIVSPTTPANCGTVSNTASASASNESNTSNNSGSGSITVQCPDIAVTKLPDATPVNGGSPIGFKITVSNAGAGTAKTVTLTDTLPTNPGLNWTIDPSPLYTDPGCTISSGVLSCSYATIASGGSKKVHITSNTTTSTCGTVTNTASATATNERSTDTANNSTTATITMTDVTAPVIALNSQTITMWSPNHKYETVKVTDLVASVSDSCSTSLPLSAVYISKVTSDEPENINSGDGNTFKDMVIANDCKSVDLRAERDGSKNGRVYTITFTVTDTAGNVGTQTAKVTVPHSQGPKGTAIEDPVAYIVTNPNCP